jgi:fructokinase
VLPNGKDMSMSEKHRPIIVGLGEVLWDCFPDRRRPGGAPANVAFHANQLGLHGVVYSRVGRDELGDEMLPFLAEQGLQTDYVFRDAHHPTGQAVVAYDEFGEPSFQFVPNVAWDHLEFHAAAETLMNSAAAVCFGTLAQRHEDSREAIHRCLASIGPLGFTVYDANLRAPFYEREWIERSLHAADWLKVSREEVAALASLFDWPEHAPAPFAARMRQEFGVEFVCITHGAEGCELLTEGEEASHPGERVAAPDPVGAGDAFTAALIFARLQGWDLSKTAEFANRYAALVASRPGAMPSLADEVEQLLRG